MPCAHVHAPSRWAVRCVGTNAVPQPVYSETWHTTVNTPTRHCGLCHTLRAMLRTRSLETALPSGLRPGWYAQLSAISGTVSYQVEWVSHTGTNQHGWAHIQLLSFSST